MAVACGNTLIQKTSERDPGFTLYAYGTDAVRFHTKRKYHHAALALSRCARGRGVCVSQQPLGEI
jgi:hypothetical protein